MITAIIIDDELNAREFLRKLILRYFSEKIVILTTCQSVEEGVNAIKLYEPELVFLDIQMPNENGFELFKHFSAPIFSVIFTTAHKNFAIDAIRHSALDYLLKPINYIDLLSAIKRLETKKSTLQQKTKIELLLDNISVAHNTFNKVALPTQQGYDLIKLNNIVYCQSESNYCKITCIDGKQILMAKTLKFVEELLGNQLFVRIHKSYLVNLNYVIKFDKVDDLKVTLANGEQLPVSIRKKEHFINAILQKK
ncbi:MAG: response regulator [Lutibacter sp.]|uniref:LytR/AlgR family response regulator transcription factor n=1 Tax=Lutibacter sp. TaxID=1925666 RepID=UPI0019F4801A|nr:LytTR family DNA-binding domain-containing protein [Lutibacter sp.]NOR29007.1 response regulator [Lutibacter sp.]